VARPVPPGGAYGSGNFPELSHLSYSFLQVFSQYRSFTLFQLLANPNQNEWSISTLEVLN